MSRKTPPRPGEPGGERHPQLPLTSVLLLALVLGTLVLLVSFGWQASAALGAIGGAGLIADELRRRLS